MDQLVVERPLQRADCDKPAVRGFVHLVVGGAGVGEVRAGLVAPASLGEQAVEQGREQRGAVHHGRVHDLAFPGRARLQQGADDPEGKQHPAAAEVTDEAQRWNRPVPAAAEVVQRPGERDVVDVMAGGPRERTVLPPPGHPGVDQPGVAGEAHVRPEAQPFHRSRTEPFDQNVRGLHQPQERVLAGGILQVEGDRPPTAVHRVAARVGLSSAGLVVPAGGGTDEPVHPHDVRAHVGEQHRPERRRPEPRHLQHPHAREWTGHARLLVTVAPPYG